MTGSVRCLLVRRGLGREAFFGEGLETVVDGSVWISDPGVDGKLALVVRNGGIGAGVVHCDDVVDGPERHPG